jgi:DNA-binding SARP family transcriptional activator/tetratricopeptide (TPR) repeat protein
MGWGSWVKVLDGMGMWRSLAARPFADPSQTLQGLPAGPRGAYGRRVKSGVTRVQVCGPLAVEVDGEAVSGALPGRQGGLVVAYLTLNRGRAVAREELPELLWPDEAPADPTEALAGLLSKVRRVLGRDVLEGRRELRLVFAGAAEVDWEQAAHALAGARSAAGRREWRAATEQAERAIAVTERGFLVGHGGPWVEERRRELEEVRHDALETAATGGVALGAEGLAGAERAARALVEAAPFRESGHRLLMEALAGRGNVAEALQVYDRLRVLLRDELGTAPAPEVQELHGRLLAGQAAGPRRPVPLPALLAPQERSAFVGRGDELEVLRAAWRDARAGRRRLVLVAGEPGIGKTRLTSEVANEVHADGTVLYASCQEEALVTYEPFVEALRHYARTTPVDVAALGPGGAELARLIPELAGDTPAPAPSADPETRRYLLFEAVSALLAAASAQAPLLLILDDLHWADRATLHLLRHVTRDSREAALLIVGTYRDAEVDAAHPLAALLADLRRERRFERVSLRGLVAGDVGALIAAHAGHEAPAALTGTVHEQTAGNPFFVAEVLRHLIETGVLFESGGRWVSALRPEEIGVPEGVKEVLARRLARLSAECREALVDAAVLGRDFCFEVLCEMRGADEDALIAALEDAVTAQLVVERPGPSYAFSHALVRETLYGGLSERRRQRLHVRAAAAIEAVEGETEVAPLAVHHRLAGSAGDAAKAIDYSLRAGAQARELSAWDETAEHWEGAVTVMAREGGRAEERGRLLLALADVMVVAGDLGRQIGYLEQALALFEESGDDERAAQAHSRLGMAHSLIDSIYGEHLDIARAFRHFDAARRVLDQGPVRKARGHLDTGVSTAMTYALRMPEGLEAARRGMDIAEQVGDELLWAGAAEAYGWHLIASGDLSEGLAVEERAFEVADRAQRSFLAWMGMNILGQLTWGLGAPDEAQPFFERQIDVPYAGKTAYRRQVADGIGRCHASRGELTEARRLLSDARPTWITHSLKPLLDLWDGDHEAVHALALRVLDTSRATGNRWDEWASNHLAARVHHVRGELEPAAALLERALAIVVDGVAPYFEMWVRPDLARVDAEAGRVEQARVHVERCLEIAANGEDWRGRGGHASLAEAIVLSHEDRMDEATAAFDRARAALERHRLRTDEADALHEWGRALARAGDGRAAAERLEEAQAAYRDHGAGAFWLERVDAELRGVTGVSR